MHLEVTKNVDFNSIKGKRETKKVQKVYVWWAAKMFILNVHPTLRTYDVRQWFSTFLSSRHTDMVKKKSGGTLKHKNIPKMKKVLFLHNF